MHRVGTARPGAELYGIDYEERAAQLAEEHLREHSHRAAIARGSAYELPFDEASFDTVLMTEVIEHLENAERAVKEADRMLRKGGRFFVTTPNQQPDFVWNPGYHVHEFSQDELVDALSAHFADVEVGACCPMR